MSHHSSSQASTTAQRSSPRFSPVMTSPHANFAYSEQQHPTGGGGHQRAPTIHYHQPSPTSFNVIVHESHPAAGSISPRPSSSASANVIRWSSGEREVSVAPTVASGSADCVQIQPIETRYSTDSQGRVFSEHGHKMVVDGDAYTLVIVDCAPQAASSYESAPSSAAASAGASSSGAAHRLCDCHTSCYCQTELIVRQQVVPHDHVCQHSCTSQQHIQYQQNQLAIENRAANRSPSSQESERRFASYNQQQENILRESTSRRQNQYTSRTDTNIGSFTSPYATGSTPNETLAHTGTETNQTKNELSQFWRQDREDVSILNQQQYRNQQPNYQQPAAQKQKPQPPQAAPSSPEMQQPSELKAPRPGAKIVKRWDWNQERFIETEVPDRPVQRPPPEAKMKTSTPSTSKPTDVWNQELLSLAESPTQPTIQYDPSWLAYRVPDVDSVKADPLYADLMLELQRLEEGVIPKPESVEPILTPETTQKPVFGQQITPESVEAQEYENIEFYCRIIPISDPSMKVEWLLNGSPLQESSRYTNEYDFGVARLRIKRCEAEDSGVYECRASNLLGEATSSARLKVHAKGNVQCETLNPAGMDAIRQLENPKQVEHVEEAPVQAAPKFLTHIQDYVEKEEGESVHFECCLGPVDDPDLKTEWFFNGRPLVTGSRFHTIDDFGFIVLDIDWLFPRDTGEYVCRATNKYGTDITRTVLRVKPDKNIVLDSQLENPGTTIDKLRQLEFPEVEQEVFVDEPDKPAHFVQHLRSSNNKQHFNEGDNVHFEARVGPATDGNLTVEWYHDDKPLISGHRFKPSFDFGHILLDILYVYPEDTGVYKCVAKNATGTDVSQFEIHVTGKPSLVYQSQLPKEMIGGVQKLTEMEAMWNRPPEPEEDEAPAERVAPQFVLKPKPCTAFEGSCARFCCRIIGHPRPRLTWAVNGQNVVSGSRYKLTHDGMYHLIIPKCQLSDAGKVEVYAKNPLGECFCVTELQVKRKVDDYRGVLKNSPNPWYDEATLKMYRRQRSMDLTEDDDDYEYFERFKNQREQLSKLRIGEMRATSPFGNQVVGYMEPGTPDVNLLARTNTPLVDPGDLHPVVAEQQVVMAPAPSTIKRALDSKDSIKNPEKSFHPDTMRGNGKGEQRDSAGPTSVAVQQQDLKQQQQQHSPSSGARADPQDSNQQQQRVFGVNLPRPAANKSLTGGARSTPSYLQQQQARIQQQRESSSWTNQWQPKSDPKDNSVPRHASPFKHSTVDDSMHESLELQHHYQEQQQNQHQQRLSISSTSSSQLQQQGQFDPRLPPPSPESTVHGKEVHSQTHKQTQLERRANKEIVREIIERETFEQEHKGVTKDNMVRGSSVERGYTPTREIGMRGQVQHQQVVTEEQQVLIEDYMTPPEFVHKIQPCQAIDGDEAKFECSFIGDPPPTISWFRESKLIRPSNMFQIVTDSAAGSSQLVIKRVTLNSNAVYTVKAENVAGSAKSSANLVVEAHPLPGQSRGGVARQFEEGAVVAGTSSGVVSTSNVVTTTSTTTTNGANLDDSLISDTSESSTNRAIKSVRTRRLSPDAMASLIRASPEGMVAPAFLHTIHETVGKVGELVRLDVRLVGTQPMEVRWLRDGQRVRADQGHKLLLEGDQYTYMILECSQEDEGFYECAASNKVGEARCGATLSVVLADGRQSALSGYQTPDMMTASYSGGGQQATFAAVSRSSESPQSFAASSSSVSTGAGASKQHYGLTKHQYNPLMGQYTTTESGLQKMDQIPKLIKRLENQQVMEGKPVVLRCQISSYPPVAEVHWYKEPDNKLIKPSKYFRLYKDNEETYCLKILETFAEDQGEYRCVAKAPNGYVETKATITVLPNSPR